MQELVLDYSKWRCGGNKKSNIYKLGKGDTQLLNNEGFMCCLGQFSLQLDEKLTESEILNQAFPENLKREIPSLSTYYDNNEYPFGEAFTNTELSDEAADINDNSDTTPEQKIELLKELFKRSDYKITVINKL